MSTAVVVEIASDDDDVKSVLEREEVVVVREEETQEQEEEEAPLPREEKEEEADVSREEEEEAPLPREQEEEEQAPLPQKQEEEEQAPPEVTPSEAYYLTEQNSVASRPPRPPSHRAPRLPGISLYRRFIPGEWFHVCIFCDNKKIAWQSFKVIQVPDDKTIHLISVTEQNFLTVVVENPTTYFARFDDRDDAKEFHSNDGRRWVDGRGNEVAFGMMHLRDGSNMSDMALPCAYLDEMNIGRCCQINLKIRVHRTGPDAAAEAEEVIRSVIQYTKCTIMGESVCYSRVLAPDVRVVDYMVDFEIAFTAVVTSVAFGKRQPGTKVVVFAKVFGIVFYPNEAMENVKMTKANGDSFLSFVRSPLSCVMPSEDLRTQLVGIEVRDVV